MVWEDNPFESLETTGDKENGDQSDDELHYVDIDELQKAEAMDETEYTLNMSASEDDEFSTVFNEFYIKQLLCPQANQLNDFTEKVLQMFCLKTGPKIPKENKVIPKTLNQMLAG